MGSSGNTLVEWAHRTPGQIVAGLIVLAVTLLALRFAPANARRLLGHTHLSRNWQSLSVGLATIALGAVGLFVALPLLGVLSVPLFGAAFFALLLSSSASDLGKSVLNGAYLLGEGQVQIGKVIQVENGPAGLVLDMTPRCVLLQNVVTGSFVLEPNSRVFSSEVTVLSDRAVGLLKGVPDVPPS